MAETSPPDSAGDISPPAALSGEEVSPADLAASAAAQMLSVDARRVVLIGTVLFAIGTLALLPLWSWLGSHHHRVWLWTCLAGMALGLVSLPLVDRHKRQGRLG